MGIRGPRGHLAGGFETWAASLLLVVIIAWAGWVSTTLGGIQKDVVNIKVALAAKGFCIARTIELNVLVTQEKENGVKEN